MIDAQINEEEDVTSLIAGDDAENSDLRREHRKEYSETRIKSKCPISSMNKTLTNETVADNAVIVLVAG